MDGSDVGLAGVNGAGDVHVRGMSEPQTVVDFRAAAKMFPF